ncbi:D-lactonohydrolase [Xylaria sp. FL1042]|nr:D-lactonohydrolase [Xylaria sp. FL1042]
MPRSAMGGSDNALSTLDSSKTPPVGNNTDAKGDTSWNMTKIISTALAVLSVGVAVRAYGDVSDRFSGRRFDIPAQAQFIDQKAFNVLPSVLPPIEFNLTSIFVPPGYDLAALKEKPFHVYDDEFYDVIGPNPTLTLIAQSEIDPIFHEAVVWYPPTNEVFFAQSAGNPLTGTGLNKSAIIQKISLDEAEAVSTKRNATGRVKVEVVNSNPTVLNPNGATNYKGNILFASEGQGPDKASDLVIMNPREPYNTTVLVNNYFGRQFNSLNDIAINPRNKEVYFTDPIYGRLQDFRPAEGLPHQVYRYNDKTGAVTIVADGLSQPNGITFSPTGSHAYIADTGAQQVFWGLNATFPASIYRYDVADDGTFSNRKTFAYVHSGVPDGIHVDTKGRLYAACGDGVHVFNPSGTLIGKIFLGQTSANFNFAGEGGMVICAETELFYAKMAVTSGAYTGDC